MAGKTWGPSGAWGRSLSSWFTLSIRLGLAFIFIYAGAGKLVDPKGFALVISRYDLVPEAFLPLVAVGLPLLELVAGIALAFKARGSLRIITGLLLLFVLVLGYGVLSDLNIDCGCFGPEEFVGRTGLRDALIRDLMMMAGAGYLFYSRRRAQSGVSSGKR